MSDVQIMMVPKDLYYHEVAYVRGLEKKNAELAAALAEARKPFATQPTLYAPLLAKIDAALKAAGEK